MNELPEVRKAKDGKYYVYRRTMRPAVGGYLSEANSKKVSKVFRPHLLEKRNSIRLILDWVGFPKEFEGKYVQFVVEIVGEKERKEDIESLNGDGGGKI